MNRLSKLITGILAFILLFYDQIPGVNVSIFVLIIWLLTLAGKRKTISVRTFLLLSFCTLLSLVSFAWYGDALSFFAVFNSVLITGFYARYGRINPILYPVLAFLNAVSFPFRIFYFKYWLPRSATKGGCRKIAATVIIPAFFFLLFFLVYTTGSDMFENVYQMVRLGFDLPQIIGLSCIAFFLLFNFWFPFIPKTAILLNHELKDDYQPKKLNSILPGFSLFDMETETKSGIITLILLNALLLVFVITYIYEQFFTVTPPGKLSLDIHERVDTVIFSILLAIGIVLYFFRRPETPAPLRQLSYGWIALNCMLVFSAFAKNVQYMEEWGLTFKRISVCIFLLLCLVGLFFTLLKILQNKTNAFLIKRVMISCYTTLVILAPVNFSGIVTRYNLNHGKKDLVYLQSLSYNQLILFQAYQNDESWQQNLQHKKASIKFKADQHLLSSALYYKYVEFRLEKKGLIAEKQNN